MKTFRWKVKPGMDVASAPSVRKVRFGDGYSQRAPAGLNADLKTYSVTLSVPREEATALESFLAEHGGWKAFLWTPPYEWRQIKVTCAKWSSRVSMSAFVTANAPSLIFLFTAAISSTEHALSVEHTVATTTSFDIFIQLLLIQGLIQGELRHSRTTKKRDYSFRIFKN